MNLSMKNEKSGKFHSSADAKQCWLSMLAQNCIWTKNWYGEFLHLFSKIPSAVIQFHFNTVMIGISARVNLKKFDKRLPPPPPFERALIRIL